MSREVSKRGWARKECHDSSSLMPQRQRRRSTPVTLTDACWANKTHSFPRSSSPRSGTRSWPGGRGTRARSGRKCPHRDCSPRCKRGTPTPEGRLALRLLPFLLLFLLLPPRGHLCPLVALAPPSAFGWRGTESRLRLQRRTRWGRPRRRPRSPPRSRPASASSSTWAWLRVWCNGSKTMRCCRIRIDVEPSRTSPFADRPYSRRTTVSSVCC